VLDLSESLRAKLILAAVVAALVAAPNWHRIETLFAKDSQACAGSSEVPEAGNLEEIGSATLCLLNRERSKRSLVALKPDAALARAAEAHSEDMARRGFFGHETPDGTDPARRIAAAGYRLPRTGENLGWGEDVEASPTRIVDGWMHSPGHRTNILRRGFTEIGIGVFPHGPEPTRHRAATYTTTFGGR
jgi:uncharacterized protein YkwD